jgi:hypothetical protein
MSKQLWESTLITAQVDGAALASSTTPTSLLPAAARYTLPANFFSQVGDSIRVKASGRVSTLTAVPGTLTLDVRLGTVATPIIVFNGGTMALDVTAQVNASWLFEALLTCRAIGSGTSANLIGVGTFVSRASLGNAAVATSGVFVTILPDTAPAVGTGFDSTITNVVDFFGTWSVSNAANSITLHQFGLESLN